MQISISILVANATSGISYVKRLVKNFKARVLSYPNSIFEAEPCLVATLTELNNIELLRQSSLVITPNAYNEGVLYDVIPNTPLGDMDVVRATTATRVNSAGLIEVVPRNLLGYSQQFNNAYWNKINLSIVPDSITAPNGTLTASTYIPTASPSQLTANTILKQTANITYTFSFYIKSAGLTDIRCFIWGSANTNRGEATFNVVNGSVSAIGSVGGFSNTSATINLVNNGYYLCTITTTSDTSAGVNVNFRYDNTISGASGFYIWGAQLEEGSTATEYFPTTTRLNIPRIDYTNGSCPSLLVEPQRTNVLNYSEDFSSTRGWNPSNAGGSTTTYTSNYGIAPDGTNSADRIQLALNGGPYADWLLFSPTITIGQTYTYSIYIKSLTTNCNIIFLGAITGGNIAKNITTEWVKHTYTFVANNAFCVPRFLIEAGTSTSADILVWGYQLELGSYPTSYIPTVASSVTRNADLISKTGISSLIGQTEGTIFVEANLSVNANERRVITVSNGTESQRIMFWTDGTILYANFNNLSVTIGTFPIGIAKIALGYTISGGSTTYSIKLNNNTLITGTSATAPNPLNSINIGTTTGLGLILNDRINSVQIFKTRLTNSELAQLTTL